MDAFDKKETKRGSCRWLAVENIHLSRRVGISLPLNLSPYGPLHLSTPEFEGRPFGDF